MPRGLALDHEEKRAHIRECAAQHFAAQGFGRASMAATATACGVSKALLYHYYPSKEALLADILQSHLTHLVNTVAKVAPDTPEARLQALIHAILMAYRDANAEHKLQVDALTALPREAQIPLIALQKTLITSVTDALRPLRPDLSPAQIHPVTMSVFGMLNWFYMWHRPDHGITRENYAALVHQLTIGGLASLT